MNIQSVSTALSFRRLGWEFVVLLGLSMAGTCLAFPISYFGNSNVLIGFLLIPATLFINGARRFNVIYFSVASVFGFLAATFPTKVFYLIAVMFFFLALVEANLGRVNSLILFLFFFMLPVFHQLAGILGFPIRMMLSEWAGAVLQLVGFEVVVAGNSMIFHDVEFTVDEACMGLNMLSFSMLMTVAIVAFHYRRSGLQLKIWTLLLSFALAFILVLITNLIRIISLVVFFVPPSNPAHEIIGITCLIVYTVIPMFFASRIIVNRWGTAIGNQVQTPQLRLVFRLLLLILGAALFSVGVMRPKLHEVLPPNPNVTFRGESGDWIQKDVLRFSKPGLLLYVKPISSFYSGEHTPLYCWKGSGYKISTVEEYSFGSARIFVGKIEKQGSILQTAWWYTDGEKTTIDQFEWRRDLAITGHSVVLINVTTPTRAELLKCVHEILTERSLAITFFQ